MKINETSSFFGVFAPIYYLLRTFGLAPFSFKGPTKLGNITISIWDRLYIIFTMLVYSSVLYVVTLLHYNKGLIHFFGKASFCSCVISKLLGVCYTYFKKGAIIKFLKNIEKIDRKV